MIYRKIFKISIITFLLALAVSLNSCWFYSFKGGTLDAETCKIENFTNQASIVVPLLSETLTEKLKDKFISEFSLTMVENDDADISFKGVVTDYRATPSSVASDNQAALTRLTISVKVTYENKKEPENSYETTFSNFVEFDSNLDLASIENDLIDEITDMLVQDIFNRAVNNW